MKKININEETFNSLIKQSLIEESVKKAEKTFDSLCESDVKKKKKNVLNKIVGLTAPMELYKTDDGFIMEIE